MFRASYVHHFEDYILLYCTCSLIWYVFNTFMQAV